MLQGIFEPVAERKKATLDKILQDFPKRRFILVGDSGEADLELYTDIALANPGRILAIFIRDVTSIPRPPRPFFDSSSERLGGKPSTNSPEHLDLRPTLPPRRVTTPAEPEKVAELERLIDLDDKPEPPRNGSSSLESEWNASKPPPPRRPSKPLALRSASSDPKLAVAPKTAPMEMRPSTRQAPQPPPKPRKTLESRQTQNLTDDEGYRSEGYRSTVRHKVASAYNHLPSAAAIWNHNSSSQSSPIDGKVDSTQGEWANHPHQPAPPPRKTFTSHTSYQLPTPHRTTHLDAPVSANETSPATPTNKKEEIWKRRWARASSALHNEGVYLKSWRVGSDVLEDAVRIVEKAKREENFGGKALPRWKSSTNKADFRHVE